MKITILGCGSSVGVPSVGCQCDVCQSGSSYNKRTRTSALIEVNNTRILIDASPDLRIHALTNGFHSIDATLFTHFHVDHCRGICELQAFEPKNQEKSMPIYSDFLTLCSLISGDPHLFIASTSNTPWNKCYYLTTNMITHYEKFQINEISILAFPQIHGRVQSNGFIFNDEIAYCTDIKSFPEKSWELLTNKKVLVLGCLRYKETNAHAHLDLCIEWAKLLKPQVMVLTHMSHDIEYHALKEQLEKLRDQCNIIPAYDGLAIEV